MTQFDVKEASGRLADLIARVRAGEEVVIAEGGKPAVRLVSAEENPRRKGHGIFKGQVWMADDFSAPLTEKEMEEWGI